MLNPKDRPLYECLLKLRNLGDFASFRQALADDLAALQVQLMTLTNDRDIHIAQGMARQVKKYIDLIESAPAVLEKWRS